LLAARRDAAADLSLTSSSFIKVSTFIRTDVTEASTGQDFENVAISALAETTLRGHSIVGPETPSLNPPRRTIRRGGGPDCFTAKPQDGAAGAADNYLEW
jgi:hypothetical protein